MKGAAFKLKNSVDVYLIPINDDFVHIQFYKINTREKYTIEVEANVPPLLAKLDGKKTIEEIEKEIGVKVDKEEAIHFLTHLENKGIVTKEKGSEKTRLSFSAKNRYSRQANFFDELLPETSGWEIQEKIMNSEVVIIGAGAVGGNIAIQLARAGVGTLTLVDYKNVSKSSLLRHAFSYKEDVGKPKVDVLKRHLEKINKDIKVIKYNRALVPDSCLDEFITKKTSLVVNTADEPYIGHITLKLGRELWSRGVSLYSAGGFDAHLMCTGEFIIPGVTPCADCYANFFSAALKDWKPRYSNEAKNNNFQGSGFSGISMPSLGAGGVASQSMFSASYACIQIMKFLSGNAPEGAKLNYRGEYLSNSGTMTWVEMDFTERCKCGQQ